MNTNAQSENSSDANSAEIPKAEISAHPTYAPAGMAMGVTMLAWGILTHWTMSLAGAGLASWALSSWINEIRKEWLERDEQRRP